MSPAFHNAFRAFLFAALLVFCLTLPLLLFMVGMPSKEQHYRGISERAGDYKNIRREIFEERSEVDVLFCGSSLMRSAIDVNVMSAELGQALGRKAVVTLIPQAWQGVDMIYFLSRDLMEHRRVKMLVISSPAALHHSDRQHVQLFRLARFGDYPGAWDGLALRYRVPLYAGFVLGAPRELLTLLRPNRLERQQPADAAADTEPGDPTGYLGRPFVPREPPAPRIAASTIVYARDDPHFRFDGEPLNAYQLHFMQKTAELAGLHGTRLAILHLPSPAEYGKDFVPERSTIMRFIAQGAAFAGVPAARLFEGMSRSDSYDFFSDEHLNRNGMRLFTRTVAPALVQIYRQSYAR